MKINLFARLMPKTIMSVMFFIGACGPGMVVEERPPLHMFDLSIQDGGQDELFDQAEIYAKAHGLKISTTVGDYPLGARYIFEMWRADVRIFGQNTVKERAYNSSEEVSFDPNRFSVVFSKGNKEPDALALAMMAEDFRRAIDDLDGVVVSERSVDGE